MRRAVVALAVVAALPLLSACDNRPCLKGHDEVTVQLLYINGSTQMVPETYFVCDVYGPEPKK